VAERGAVRRARPLRRHRRRKDRQRRWRRPNPLDLPARGWRPPTAADFFCPKLEGDKSASAKSVGWCLKQHVDEPVGNDGWTFILRSQKDPSGGSKSGKLYKVVVKKMAEPPSDTKKEEQKHRSEEPGRPPTDICARCKLPLDGTERRSPYNDLMLHRRCEDELLNERLAEEGIWLSSAK
jgi:hypothetical protein